MEETTVGEPPLIEAEKEQAPLSAAELVVMGLAALLDAFEKELEEGESIQALFISSNGEVLDVEGFGAALPDFVYFDGRDSERRKTRAIVASGSATLTLKTAPVLENHDDTPRGRVGFRIRTTLLPEQTPPDL